MAATIPGFVAPALRCEQSRELVVARTSHDLALCSRAISNRFHKAALSLGAVDIRLFQQQCAFELCISGS